MVVGFRSAWMGLLHEVLGFCGWFLGSGCWVLWVEAAVAELWWLRFVGCGLCWAIVGFVGLFYLGVQLGKVGLVGFSA